jgi:uncharacterized protein involved in exopolysaccharide biosynthesis
MSQEDQFSVSELHRKRAQVEAATTVVAAPAAHPPGPRPAAARRPAADDEEDPNSEWSVDKWRVLAALKRRWYWLAASALVLGLLGAAGGYYKGKYTVTIKLIQNPSPGGVMPSAGTLSTLLKSPDLIRRVATKANPPIAPDRLLDSLTVDQDPKTDLLSVTLLGKNARALADLINLYANEAVTFTRDLQVANASRDRLFFQEKVANYDDAVRRVNERMRGFLKTNNTVDPKVESEALLKKLGDTLADIENKKIEKELAGLRIAALQEELEHQNPVAERLAQAKAKRTSLLGIYTEKHPEVEKVNNEIAALERQLAEGTSANGSFPLGSLASTLQNRLVELKASLKTLDREIEGLQLRCAELQKAANTLSELNLDYFNLKAELEMLQSTRGKMAVSLQDAQVYEDKAQGYYRVFALVSLEDVDLRPRMQSAKSFGVKGALGGLLLSAALVFLIEMKDRTMKTVAEVERITGLRVLSTLGDLDRMTPQQQDTWAFRAWTIIAGQLSVSANHGLVCGIISSRPGEGRSTWIRLLGHAASQRGLRVLTVATKPSGQDEPSTEAENQASEHSFSEAVDKAMAETQSPAAPDASDASADETPATTTLSPSVLAFPAEVAQRFKRGDLPAAHIPLPGWVWNLERRRQWQMALAHWRSVDNLVLLVELPPASVPESVLLAENLPQLLWLVDSGKPHIRETKEQLEMLHHGKCRIVGAVLNHEPEPLIKL